MKILQVSPVLSAVFGGPPYVVRSISKELAKRHDVVVYTTTALDLNHDVDPKEEEVNGYKVIYFSRTLKPLCYSHLLGQLNLSVDMMKAVKHDLKKFDIIHLHSWRQFPDIMVHYYAKRYGVPYVLQVHGSLPRIMAKQGLKWLYDVFFGYRLLRDASKVVALSQMEAQQYRSMGVSEEKIEVIPNGIILAEYAQLPPKGYFRKKFSIDHDEKIVLYLGRLHRIKGIDILVNAFATIVGKLENTKLVIVGPDDDYLGELEALIKALKIEDNVLISGPLYGRDKLEAYVDADAYVLPSRYETFPMSVLESVACGTPVILTENCGIAAYFRDKVGLVVKPDPNHLREALLEMLLDRDKQATFRENCKTVIKGFNISKTASKLEEVYEDIAN